MKADVKTNIDLPGKSEQVLFCRLTDDQRDTYQEYLDSRECAAILAGKYQVRLKIILVIFLTKKKLHVSFSVRFSFKGVLIIIIYFICKAQFKYKTNSFHSFSLRGSVTNSHMIVNNINKLVKKLSEQVGL